MRFLVSLEYPKFWYSNYEKEEHAEDSVPVGVQPVDPSDVSFSPENEVYGNRWINKHQKTPGKIPESNEVEDDREG